MKQSSLKGQNTKLKNKLKICEEALTLALRNLDSAKTTIEALEGKLEENIADQTKYMAESIKERQSLLKQVTKLKSDIKCYKEFKTQEIGKLREEIDRQQDTINIKNEELSTQSVNMRTIKRERDEIAEKELTGRGIAADRQIALAEVLKVIKEGKV